MSRLAYSLVASARRDLGLIARQTRRNGIFYVVIAVLLTIALAAGVLSLGLHLAATLGPVYAALFIALVMLALALGLLAFMMVLNRMERRRERAARAGRALAASATISALSGVSGSKSPLLLAAVGGLAFLLTRSRFNRPD